MKTLQLLCAMVPGALLGQTLPMGFGIHAGSTTPHIVSLSATSGIVGSSLTLTGTNFGGSAGNVKLSTVASSITSWSSTSVVISVPNANTGTIVLQTAAGPTSNAVAFAVIPHITSLTAGGWTIGQSITITGTGL